MIARFISAILTTVVVTSVAQASEVKPVERGPFESVLQGLVDFESVTTADFPGTPYFSRLPFEGVIFSTFFKGQNQFVKNDNGLLFGDLAGKPSAPLKEGIKRQRYAKLYAARLSFRNPNTNALFSNLIVVHQRNPTQHLGFGSLVAKFTNQQFVIGFNFRPVGMHQPRIEVRFLDIDGHYIGASHVLTSFGEHTFATSDQTRLIKGIELINLGNAPLALDDVVFELPLFIG